MRLGLDFGGTKIEAALLDADGTIRHRLRKPTPRHDYAGTLETARALIDEIEDLAGPIESIGAGIPGALDPVSGLVKNANSTWLNGRPMDQDLASVLGRPIRLANDANCFALSEAIDGAGAGADVVFGVIVGTGCGGGIVVHQRILSGPNAIAGEWGHHPLPWPDDEERQNAPPCYCGGRGCLETWISGPGLEADFTRTTGRRLSAKDIAAAAAASDDAAVEALERYCARMARGLAQIVNILDPDVIVLGGGMSNVPMLYERVPDLMVRHVLTDRLNTRLLPNKHGDSSGVRGAAWLWATPGSP